MLTVSARHPELFGAGLRVVEMGSLDINGSVRGFWEGSEYTGLDVGAGNGVDVVVPAAHTWTPREPVDVVVTTEMLEHDKYWRESVGAAYRWLRPGGLFVGTCADPTRGEHGTNKAGNPYDNPFLAHEDYYKGISEEELREVWPEKGGGMVESYQSDLRWAFVKGGGEDVAMS